MIVEKIIESKRQKIKQYPVNSNRASDLGHPCIRYHVFNRTRWEERALHDVGLQFVFDMGNEIEDIVLKELAAAGVKVIEQQRSFSWPEYQITGHVDGKIVTDDGVYPMEIKSCSPYVFKTINTIEDLKHGKYLYLRKYPVQLTLYLLMDNKDRGVFIFKDKTSGQIKEVWMDLDYALGEAALKRAEAVNAHVAAGTMPECMEYDEQICGDCPYVHLCLPEVVGKEVVIMDRTDIAEWLDRMAELKPLHKEYDDLDAQVKKAVEGVEKAIVGKWFVSGKWMDRKPYEVKGGRYWQKKIIPVEARANA